MYFSVNGGPPQSSNMNWKTFRKSFQKNHRVESLGPKIFKITDSLGVEFTYKYVD